MIAPRIRFFFVLFALSTVVLRAESSPESDFAVLTFNVENLFDVDGVALFDDYAMETVEPGNVPYSAALLGKKLDFIVRTVAAINDGEGPEVILFQELERDQTPDTTLPGVEEFLATFEEMSLAEMLEKSDLPEIRGLPSYAFLIKALAEEGLSYPYVALAESGGDPGELPAHINAVFSRFPIRGAESFPTLMAREVLVVELDVEGCPFTVINNHWKSGASNPETEGIRIENAKTVRRILDRLLADDPQADILVGGDLNSYYDQIVLFPEMGETGINSILGSQGQEQALLEGEADLYNLWFELPQADRFTETWRDRKGTLMHMLVTPGLYDGRGIDYVDHSFRVVTLPGLNIDEWGRPQRFRFAGGGRGGSDHLPILARFVVAGENGTPQADLLEPGREADQPGKLLYVNYSLDRDGAPTPLPMNALFSLPEENWSTELGKLYEVEGRLEGIDPLMLDTGEHRMEVYCTTKASWQKINRVRGSGEVRFFAELGMWDGNFQWVVRDPGWIPQQ